MKFDDNIKSLNEGLWDKTKARAAGAVGAVKGVGDRLAGSAIGAIGGATNNQAAVQAGQAQKQRGQAKGQISKIESYKKSAFNKINKLSEEIFKDLKDTVIGKEKSKSPSRTTTGTTPAREQLKAQFKQLYGGF